MKQLIISCMLIWCHYGWTQAHYHVIIKLILQLSPHNLYPQMKCPASVVIPPIAEQWSCSLGRFGIVEPDYVQGQLHSSRAPTDSVWSTSYETQQMVPRGWESVNHFVHTLPAENSWRERWIFGNRGMILTLIHWLEPQLLFPWCSDVCRWYRGISDR